MIPAPIIRTAIAKFYEHKRGDDADDVAMTKALHDALQGYCTCGEPLMLGVTHHKNSPCEFGK
jgi:hypothetical protein